MYTYKILNNTKTYRVYAIYIQVCNIASVYKRLSKNGSVKNLLLS